jgi:hypothetical protein
MLDAPQWRQRRVRAERVVRELEPLARQGQFWMSLDTSVNTAPSAGLT